MTTVADVLYGINYIYKREYLNKYIGKLPSDDIENTFRMQMIFSPAAVQWLDSKNDYYSTREIDQTLSPDDISVLTQEKDDFLERSKLLDKLQERLNQLDNSDANKAEKEKLKLAIQQQKPLSFGVLAQLCQTLINLKANEKIDTQLQTNITFYLNEATKLPEPKQKSMAREEEKSSKGSAPTQSTKTTNKVDPKINDLETENLRLAKLLEEQKVTNTSLKTATDLAQLTQAQKNKEAEETISRLKSEAASIDKEIKKLTLRNEEDKKQYEKSLEEQKNQNQTLQTQVKDLFDTQQQKDKEAKEEAARLRAEITESKKQIEPLIQTVTELESRITFHQLQIDEIAIKLRQTASDTAEFTSLKQLLVVYDKQIKDAIEYAKLAADSYDALVQLVLYQNNEEKEDARKARDLFRTNGSVASAYTLPIDLKNSKGYDLNIMANLPEKLNDYKNSFILENTQLHYINSNGKSRVVKLINAKNFFAMLHKLNPNNKNKLHLSAELAHQLIILNGGKLQAIIKDAGFILEKLSKKKGFNDEVSRAETRDGHEEIIQKARAKVQVLTTFKAELLSGANSALESMEKNITNLSELANTISTQSFNSLSSTSSGKTTIDDSEKDSIIEEVRSENDSLRSEISSLKFQLSQIDITPPLSAQDYTPSKIGNSSSIPMAPPVEDASVVSTSANGISNSIPSAPPIAPPISSTSTFARTSSVQPVSPNQSLLAAIRAASGKPIAKSTDGDSKTTTNASSSTDIVSSLKNRAKNNGINIQENAPTDEESKKLGNNIYKNAKGEWTLALYLKDQPKEEIILQNCNSLKSVTDILNNKASNDLTTKDKDKIARTVHAYSIELGLELSKKAAKSGMPINFNKTTTSGTTTNSVSAKPKEAKTNYELCDLRTIYSHTFDNLSINNLPFTYTKFTYVLSRDPATLIWKLKLLKPTELLPLDEIERKKQAITTISLDSIPRLADTLAEAKISKDRDFLKIDPSETFEALKLIKEFHKEHIKSESFTSNNKESKSGLSSILQKMQAADALVTGVASSALFARRKVLAVDSDDEDDKKDDNAKNSKTPTQGNNSDDWAT